MKTRDLVTIGLNVSLIALCAQIRIPLFIPFTLQLLAIYLISFTYNSKITFISIFTYLMLGFIGFPIFTAFSGGPASFLSPTIGFLWGFLIIGLINTYLKQFSILNFILLTIILYTFGLVGIKLYFINILNVKISFYNLILNYFLVFIITDFISYYIGFKASLAIKKVKR